jgi:gliding motility-associated-like protein
MVVIELSGMAPFELVYAIDAVEQPAILTNLTVYSFETDEPGLYTLVSVEDQFCDGETAGQAELEVVPYPLADPGPVQEVCYGQEVITLGGTPEPGFSYSWTNSQFLSDANAPNPQLIYNNPIFVPIPLSFTLTVSNGDCSSESSVEVTLFPVPEVQTNESVSMCEGGAAQLQVSGATNVEWTPNEFIEDATASSTWVYPPEDATYFVSVSNDYGCSTTGSVNVVVNPMPVVQFAANTDSVCAPAVVTLQNQTASEFLGSCQWNLGNGQVINSCNPNVFGYYLDNGSYNVSLTITTSAGCSFTKTEYGFVNILGPDAYFTYQPDPVDVKNTRIQFNNQSSGAVSYIWDFGDLGGAFNIHPVVDFPHQLPDSYEVCLTAIDQNGCMDDYCTVIEIEADVLIYIPNAFSPNGDGINDLFYPVMEGVDIVEYEFMIFNRRGKLVWSTTDPEAKWNGADMTGNYYDDNQVYTWTLRIKDRYSTLRENRNGTVMVVR